MDPMLEATSATVVRLLNKLVEKGVLTNVEADDAMKPMFELVREYVS